MKGLTGESLTILSEKEHRAIEWIKIEDIEKKDWWFGMKNDLYELCKINLEL